MRSANALSLGNYVSSWHIPTRTSRGRSAPASIADFPTACRPSHSLHNVPNVQRTERSQQLPKLIFRKSRQLLAVHWHDGGALGQRVPNRPRAGPADGQTETRAFYRPCCRVITTVALEHFCAVLQGAGSAALSAGLSLLGALCNQASQFIS
jgi:hypothetical protein